MKDQFDDAIQGAASDLRSNNQPFRDNITTNQRQFQDNINALAAERQRIQQILSRYNGQPPYPAVPASLVPKGTPRLNSSQV